MTPRRRLLSWLVRFLPDGVFVWLIAHLHIRIEPEMLPITKLCAPDGIAVDVGAWFGPWSYWLSRVVNRVETFEPNPFVAAKMECHLGKNVFVHRKAASDKTGIQQLFLSGDGVGLEAQSSLLGSDPSAQTLDVELVTIDSLNFRDVRLLKIDVEGYEYHVVKGAETLIKRDFPVMVIELEDLFGDIAATVKILNNMGYVGKVFRDAQWHDFNIDQFIFDQRQFLATKVLRGYLSAALKKGYGYYNNVVFVHPKSTWTPW